MGAGSTRGGVVADLVELLGGESGRSRRFLGGIVAGALLGAAMAGTVARWMARGRRPS